MASLALASVCSPAAADPVQDLTELSLEDLLTSEVTSVAKRPQTVETAAAAIFVINREDIRRSGASNIPDILRMVPGMEVAELSGGAVGVSARGFNGRYSNKLLVMIDGRSIYLSTLSGVLWDQQLVPVEDIQRIEVVRGPGGTLWGANAVNGVINIITAHSLDAMGASAVARADTTEGRSMSGRVGVAGDLGALRLHATAREVPGETGSSRAGEVGFRYDVDATATGAFTLQGDLRTGRFRRERLANPGGLSDGAEASPLGHSSGADLLARWTERQTADRGYSVQAYWDRVEQEDAEASITRDQYDLEFSHRFTALERHAIVWGAGYRHNRDHVRGSSFLTFTPERRSESWYSAFVQDEFKVAADRVTVSVGARIEHNDYTGVEVEPSARFLVPLPVGSIWGAVSSASRTPSRYEADTVPGFLGATQTEDDRDLKAEQLTAFDLGWRGPVAGGVTLDVAVFFNRYKDLLGLRFTGSQPFGPATGGGTSVTTGGGPATQPQFEVMTVNSGAAESYGLEAAMTARPAAWWTLKGAASWMELQETGTDTNDFLLYDLGSSPRYQMSLRSWFDLSRSVDLDVWIRRVGRLESGPTPAYTDLDLRLAWRPTARIQISVHGRNLMNESRVEIDSTVPGVSGAEVRRAFELVLGVRY